MNAVAVFVAMLDERLQSDQPAEKGGCKFELLNYVWLEGFCSYLFDERNQAFIFDSIDEALAELQDDFDTWKNEIVAGEREPDAGFSPEEFVIRCVTTGSVCEIALNGRQVEILSTETGEVINRAEYRRINQSGIF